MDDLNDDDADGLKDTIHELKGQVDDLDNAVDEHRYAVEDLARRLDDVESDQRFAGETQSLTLAAAIDRLARAIEARAATAPPPAMTTGGEAVFRN